MEDRMSKRAAALAGRFVAANDETIAAAEGYSENQWATVCSAEGWSVGTLAHHLAGAHGLVMGLAEGLAGSGQLPPVTWEMIHGMNAQHAQEHGACDQRETVALLRSTGDAVAARIRALGDAGLDRAAPWGLADGASLSAAQLIERHIIEHAQGHLFSIRETAGAAR